MRPVLPKTILLLFVFILLIGQAECPATEVSDQGGQTITFDHPFQRIISLYPAHTENLVSLGIGPRLIGISTSDDFPPGIMETPRFSYKDNPEKFIAATPDLILIRPMIEGGYPELIHQLRQAGIVVLSLQPTSIAQMYHYWLKLGRLTGLEAKALGMINRFQTALVQQKQLVDTIPPEKRPRVYFESIHKRMKTFSPTSIPMFCLEYGGGINVAGDAKPRRKSNIAAYGKEKILAHGQEIDVFLAQVGRMNRVSRKIIEEEPGFGAIKGVRDHAVYLLDEQLVSRPTMRLLEGITMIHTLLYPKTNQQTN